MLDVLKNINLGRISTWWKKLNENRHFKYGAPFMILVVGSPFVLQHLMSVRYEYRNVEFLTPEKVKELEQKGVRVKPKSETTLEKIYEETVKNTPDDYEMIRGPRPWEDNSKFDKMVEDLNEKNKDRKLKTIPDKKAAYGL